MRVSVDDNFPVGNVKDNGSCEPNVLLGGLNGVERIGVSSTSGWTLVSCEGVIPVFICGQSYLAVSLVDCVPSVDMVYCLVCRIFLS